MVSLEYAKQHINLVELAVNKFQYSIDKRKSSKFYKTLKKDVDVIVVRKNASNGHWIYFNARIDNDAGTIVDFLQNRGIGNLGQVRRFLSEYLKERKEGKIKTIEDFEVKASDTNKRKNEVLLEFSRLKEITEDNYLTRERMINYIYIKRNNKHIFTDSKGNAVFLLHNEKGELIGLSKYNSNFKQVIGAKGVWTSAIGKEDIYEIKTIVIGESPIDLLSYAELEDRDDLFLVSTQGQVSDKTLDIIHSYIKAIAKIKIRKMVDIILAFDNDEAGRQFAEKVKSGLIERAIKDNLILKIKSDFPGAKDWNDELKRKKENLFPIATTQ